MKIKVPKKDIDGKLVYDSGGGIEYEEKELLDGIPLEVVLNKLGEPDTIITIKVTSEAGGSNVSEYNVTIKRQYGVIKGKCIVGLMHQT